jgi:hypothetical protein
MKLTNILLAVIAVFWVFSLLSIEFIPERCIVCGQQKGSNAAETLRTLSVIDWACDTVPDIHFNCLSGYDGNIHSPNRSK